MLDHPRRPRPLVASALAAGAGLALLVTAAAGMAHNPRVPRDFGVTSAPDGRSADRRDMRRLVLDEELAPLTVGAAAVLAAVLLE